MLHFSPSSLMIFNWYAMNNDLVLLILTSLVTCEHLEDKKLLQKQRTVNENGKKCSLVFQMEYLGQKACITFSSLHNYITFSSLRNYIEFLWEGTWEQTSHWCATSKMNSNKTDHLSAYEPMTQKSNCKEHFRRHKLRSVILPCRLIYRR